MEGVRKNRLKQIGLMTCLMLMLLVFCQNPVLAENRLEDLTIEVELKADGSALITEKRQVYADSGTENYIGIGHLEGATITQFSVEENGEVYQNIGNDWDINAGKAHKSKKCGVVEKPNGIELCWGIGEYGTHDYIVRYTVNGMVRQLTDGQALNWVFLSDGTNIPPQKAKVQIKSITDLNEENARIWGFGFNGTVNFVEGAVLAKTNEPLSSEGHLTVLLQFLDAPFSPILNQEISLYNQEQLAKEGSSYEGESASGEEIPFMWSTDDFFNPPILFFMVAMMFLFVFGVSFVFKARSRYGIRFQELKKEVEDQYYRDLPYEGAVSDVKVLLDQLNMGGVDNYVSAYFLKWIQEGRLRNTVVQNGLLFKKDQDALEIIVTDCLEEMSQGERELFKMVCQASGKDQILEAKEFSRWSNAHGKELSKWQKDDLNQPSEDRLIEKGYLEYSKPSKMARSRKLTISSQGEELAKTILKFKNFLKDFTLLDERTAPEVTLWKDLLIWAALMGLAETVAKSFERLQPTFFQDNGYSVHDVVLLNHFALSINQSIHAHENPASGSGGMSSVGGGGGSFGGGGGGGIR